MPFLETLMLGIICISFLIAPPLPPAPQIAVLWSMAYRLRAFSTETYPAQNLDTQVNSTVLHSIGRYGGVANYLDGLMALPILVDGAALDATSFGELDADGYWNPIEYTGSYGTNGGAYDFADSSWFGKNVSGADDQAALSAAAPSATAWLNITGAWTMGSGTASRTSTVNAIRSASVFTGDFSLALTMASGATAARVGVYAANEDGTFVSSGADSAGLNSMTNSFYANFGAGTFFKGASSTVGVSQTNGAITITRVSGTITINTAGGNHTFAATYTGPMRLAISGGADTMSFTSIAYTADGQAGNSFFDSGFATTDQLADTPTDSADEGIGNRLVFNANNKGSSSTLSEANSKITGTGAAWAGCYSSIMIPTTGVWYVAAKYAGTYDGSNAGVLALSTRGADITTANYDYSGSYAAVAGGGVSGEIRYSGANQASVSMTTNDEIGFLVDRDTDVVKVYKNGALVHTYSQLPGTTELWASGWVYGSSGSINLINDQTKLVSGAPSGSLDIATQNLPAPTIADGSQYFNTVIYTGNGSTQAITGVGFQPDLVWIKARETVTSNGNHGVWDAVRGCNNHFRCDICRYDRSWFRRSPQVHNGKEQNGC
jgi:hypothetical protein